MAATRTSETRLSDEDVAKVMGLIKGSDSVELKLTVPESEHSGTVSALEMDPLDAQIRQVFFFDTPDLTLYEHGVVARARRVQRKGDDSVVKLRPVVPSQLPGRVRKLPEFGVEVDAMPGGFVCSGSMKGVPGQDVRETLLGQRRKSKLFSKAQQAFYAEHAPEGIELDDLSILGPIFILKSAFQTALVGHAGAPERRMVAEMWLYPDGSRILEMSLKCLPADAFQVAAETRAYLAVEVQHVRRQEAGQRAGAKPEWRAQHTPGDATES